MDNLRWSGEPALLDQMCLQPFTDHVCAEGQWRGSLLSMFTPVIDKDPRDDASGA
jgi:hypothetical protein